MKNFVKTLVLITISFLFTTQSTAQLKLPGINGVANDVKKVIEDYPNRFINIMGEVQEQHTVNRLLLQLYCEWRRRGIHYPLPG